MVKGNEVIPIQVIRFPAGIDFSLSNAIVSTEEPETKSMIVIKVKVRVL